ncbi:YtxH domain-containing protein [Rhodohalobacter sp. 614A]|uniref:YtxH domain-containing protein n=1 Tax=Rhodohalobacter sp. 614A TaxID=2908649 RepID=UPI001F360F26|nr:YtxH domain-containing protein [Rhodohalobacter sp. 614A]
MFSINKKRTPSIGKDKFILTAVASAFGGALVGILFAPEKGTTLRKDISDKRDKYLRDIRNNAGELSRYLKNNADSLLQKTRKTVSDTEEEYTEWTKQELYDRAKELGVESYSQMNKAELIEALDNHL